VSNLLGEVNNVKELTQLARSASPNIRVRGVSLLAGHRCLCALSQVVVDGVAYAPHRAIDVKDFDCDYYVFSLYKVDLCLRLLNESQKLLLHQVYGPHVGVMFGKRDAFAEIKGSAC